MHYARDYNELTPGAVRCRAYGHSWRPYEAKPFGRMAGWNVTLICGNDCGTMKHFQLSVRGEYGQPHYSYGDGYLARFKVDRNQARLDALGEIMPTARKPRLRAESGGK